ncbi:DUF6053 domain-containing protein [Lysobacter enzymogenes]|uniref:DUF6053 domain-containing protein n=1 Tax=Lysobacter enzymogenes TaxID=69 RepID=UPI003D2F553F
MGGASAPTLSGPVAASRHNDIGAEAPPIAATRQPTQRCIPAPACQGARESG